VLKLLGSKLIFPKWLRDLVRGNEKSLSWYFAQQLHAESNPLISSTIKRTLLQPRSFIWLSELYFRETAGKALAAHNILKTKHGQFSFFSSSAICEFCQDIRMTRLKIESLKLLFSLSDCTIYGEEDHRPAQEYFLTQLSKEDLASLMTFLSLASRGYTVNKYAEEPAESTESVNVSGRSEAKERECVYRELVLRHGTFFIWASVCGNDDQKKWVKKSIDSGMKVLRDYENAPLEFKANCASSLQSFLYKEFCLKVNCDGFDVREIHRKVDEIMLNVISDNRNGGPVLHTGP
jgi:hypothetical protein